MNINKWFKGNRMKLHMFYWIVISVIISTSLFTVRGYSNEDLNNQISFGGTLSGIILSVLAIMMTLFGELKSDNTKATLERVSKQIEEVTQKSLVNVSKQLEEVTQNTLINVSNNLKDTTKRIDEATKKLECVDSIKADINQVRSRLDNFGEIFSNTKSKDDDKNTESYRIVFESYIDTREESIKKYLYLTIYCRIKLNFIDPDIKKILIKLYNEKYEEYITYALAISFVFTSYVNTDEKFKVYLISKIEEKYKDEIEKIELHKKS